MEQLDKIVEMLTDDGNFTEQPGLFYGKIGIAVFFFHYARFSGNTSFLDYAMALIEKAQKQITDKTTMRYDIGISGIGVAVEYLLQNDFLEADDKYLFEEFDDRMYRAAMHDPYSGFGLEGSLTGWGRYFIFRLRSNEPDKSKLHEALLEIAKTISKKIKLNKVVEKERPDVYSFFHDLTSIPGYAGQFAHSLHQCKEWRCISHPDTYKLFPYLGALQRLYVCQNYFNMDLTKEIEQEWKNRKEPDNNANTNMGLLNGWAAEGMLYLTRFYNLSDEWMKNLL